MARMTVGQKAERALKLLLGVRHPRIAEALEGYGFDEAELDEGFRLLRGLTHGRLGQAAPVRRDSTLLERLDAWENRWLPIARASLLRRFPDVHAWLFGHLTQTEGPLVVVSVSIFLERLARLATEASLGPAGAEARALLTRRGLDAATLAVAEELVRELRRIEPPPPLQLDAAASSAAEQALWNWYLEWAAIVRVAIKEPRLLRELGFLMSKRASAEAGVDPSETEPAQDRTVEA